MSKAKILIVEDDMIIATDISLQLTALDFEITGISTRGEDALKSLTSTQPDIVLMDIGLKGSMNGIETATQVYKEYGIPVIFLTANADEATFRQAKEAKPHAYITKPFRQEDLQRAIELVLERIGDRMKPEEDTDAFQGDYIISDRIFVRHKDKMVKIFIEDILFAKADRSYCIVHTADNEYLLSVPLNSLEKNLPPSRFMRVHRSFVVNLNKIDALNDNNEYLSLGKKHVPVSRRFKEDLIKRLKLF